MRKLSKEEKVGRKAYQAYCLYTNNKSLISGDTLPDWMDLRLEIQAAWMASTQAVIEHVRRNDET